MYIIVAEKNWGKEFSICPRIMDTMDIIKTGRKGKRLNTLEKYYIYRNSKDNLHMNDTHIHTYKTIFETLHDFIPDSSNPPPPLRISL
jgi:hypothetical protein